MVRASVFDILKWLNDFKSQGKTHFTANDLTAEQRKMLMKAKNSGYIIKVGCRDKNGQLWEINLNKRQWMPKYFKNITGGQ